MNRSLALGAAWTASAAAAVGLGFLAVSLVDASASPGTQPLAATGSPAATTSAAPTPSSTAASGQMATAGGTVFASCAGGVPDLAGAPAAGWQADDSPRPGEVEFRNGSLKVEVSVTCVDGSPVFAMEGPRADDSGGGSSAPAAPSSDDSGGGHGSDDGPGDDSSGRGGGGHGSDD